MRRKDSALDLLFFSSCTIANGSEQGLRKQLCILLILAALTWVDSGIHSPVPCLPGHGSCIRWNPSTGLLSLDMSPVPAESAP
jgi:hypothetical protein